MAENYENIYLTRIWDVYYSLEDGKKKSFDLLFLTLMIIIIFWLNPTDAIQLPVVGNELPKFVTFTLAPFFIIFLTSKYFYMSALSLNVYTAYIQYFREFYWHEYDDKNIHPSSLYNNFRVRNLSETLNLFLFPRQFGMKWELSFKVIIHFLTIIGHRIVTLLTFITPIIFSFMTTIWFINNYHSHIKEEYQGIIIIIAYVFSILILLLFLLWLINNTQEARKYYKEEVLKQK